MSVDVVFLMGPSAAGKTEVGLRLADAVPEVDLISVDSVMVYRGLDIGAAKPPAEALARHPHQLINIRDVAEPYSAAEFFKDALRQVAASQAAKRIPVLVGGSMLYFKLLRDGLAQIPPTDKRVQTAVEGFARAYGWPEVHKALQKLDPGAYARLTPNDSRRLRRAAEIALSTTDTQSGWWQRPHHSGLGGRLLPFALAPAERSTLHSRIAMRFRAMLAQGLVEETKQQLYSRTDLSEELPALKAVGYRQVLACLKGELDWPSLEPKAIAATRQMAKRQLTWLRSWQNLLWLPENPGRAMQVIARQITKI